MQGTFPLHTGCTERKTRKVEGAFVLAPASRQELGSSCNDLKTQEHKLMVQ